VEFIGDSLSKVLPASLKMLMQQAKKLIGFVFRQFSPAAWSLACFLNIPLALLDRICF